jgi:molybdenum cofactor cytidylyltransferase
MAALRVKKATVTVIGNRAVDLTAAIGDLNINFMINPDPARGMGSTIKQAVSYAVEQSRGACLIVLGDQPFVGTAHLQRLIDTSQVHPESIIATAYPGGGAGVPALFPAVFYPDLLAIGDDYGAKEVIRSTPHHVNLTVDQKSLFDVDTPADLASLSHF